MPAPIRTPRESWVDHGLRALAAGGPDAVRVEPLAKALGVTKGGFYWHFSDRQALLDEMLDAWEHLLVDQVIATVERGGGDARAMLKRLFALGASRGHILDVELAIRDWGRHAPAVAARVKRVDNRRMSYLRPLFAEFCANPTDVEARCLLVLALFVGAPSIAADHGRRTRETVLAAAVRHLLR